MRLWAVALLAGAGGVVAVAACGYARDNSCAETDVCSAADGATSLDAGGVVSDDGAVEDAGSNVIDSAPNPDVCANAPNPALGVFVVPSADGGSWSPGQNPGPCSMTAPCTQVGAGVAAAASQGKSTVYIAEGTYAESVGITSSVTLQGNWIAAANDWSLDCAGDAGGFAVVRAPDSNNETIVVTSTGDAGIAVTLDALTILSKQQAAPGETLYGIFTSGPATQLTLHNVSVSVAAGGNGAAGDAGSTPMTSTGCSSGTGANATGTGSTGKGVSAGTFSASGYVPSTDGANGGNGPSGANGSVGTTTCSSACSTNATDPCMKDGSACVTNNQGMVCGATGDPGCGGPGGTGGTPGQSGGSSIGVFASDSSVILVGGAITAASGGSGGAGGPGGAGAKGGSGQGGAAATCMVCGGTACTATPQSEAGQSAGNGGTGGTGGAGGGGAGGDSYAIYAVDQATFTVQETNLFFGAGGAGSGNGATGTAAAQGP